MRNWQMDRWIRALWQQARGQGSHTHPPLSPAWATHASSRKLQAQTGSWARTHSEQLWRRPQLVVFTCVTSVREPTRSQLYRKWMRRNTLHLLDFRVTSRLRCLHTRLPKIYNSLDTISYSQLAVALGIRPDPQGHWAWLQSAQLGGGVHPLGSRQGARHNDILYLCLGLWYL